METIHSTSRFSWGHEKMPGVRQVPPTDDELVTLKDAQGNPVLTDDGDEVKVPEESWQPQVERVELDTVLIVEQDEGGNVNVFKMAFDKTSLGRFLAFYIEHLDADGRNLVREALGSSSDIIVPPPALSKRALELVKP